MDDSLLQGAFDYAAAEDAKRKLKVRYGNGMKVYKSDFFNDEIIQTLEENLKKSKEKALENLIKVKRYQTSLNTATQVMNGLKAHVIQRGNQIGKSIGIPFNESTSELRVMEITSNFPLGYAQIVVNALKSYNDEKLYNELQNVSSSILQNMDPKTFFLIVKAASGDLISDSDCKLLYKFACLITRSDCIHSSNWQNAVQILRKKLLLLYLVRSLPRNPNPCTSVLSNFVSSDSPSMSRSLPITAKQSTFKGKCKGTKFHVDNSESNPPFSGEVIQLKNALSLSISNQKGLSDKILSSLSIITQTITSKNNIGTRNATKFAQHMALRRMEGVLVKVNIRTTGVAFIRWKNSGNFVKMEQFLTVFLKKLAVNRIFNSFGRLLQNKMKRAISNFKYAVAWLDTMECFAGAVEIQKIWRGALARLKRTKAVINFAATIITALYHRLIAYKRVAYLLYQRNVKKAIQKIENAWERLRWLRTIKRARKLKEQNLASIVVQRVARGSIGRRCVHGIRFRLKQILGAIKLQSLRRKYLASIKVDNLIHMRHRYCMAVRIQCMVRRAIAIRKINVKMRTDSYAKTIQYFFLIYSAKCKIHKTRIGRYHRKRYDKATHIQRVVRGRVGRKKAAYLRRIRDDVRQLQIEGIHTFARIFLSYHASHVLRKYYERKSNASVIITKFLKLSILRKQAIARVTALKNERNEKETLKKMLEFEAKQERERMEKAKAAAEALKLKEQRKYLPEYYKYKLDYMDKQDKTHKKFVIRIQCMLRCNKARHVFQQKKKAYMEGIKVFKAHLIKRCWLKYVEIRDSKKILNGLKEKRRRVVVATTRIQKVARGFMGRYEARKHYHAEKVKWFLDEIRKQGLMGKALANFRVRKAHIDKQNKMATKIQSVMRRALRRIWFTANYKRLVKERAKRMKARRVKAIKKIQSVMRMHLAKKIVEKKKTFFIEEEKRKIMLEVLEGKLEVMHDDWMNELLAIRLEASTRGFLAKRIVTKRSLEVKVEMERRLNAKRAACAVKIQALARGVRGRLRFKKLLPQLKKDKNMRNFCVECEQRVCVRRCKECKDRFCEICFINFHRTGYRKNHDWEHIKIQSLASAKKSKNAISVPVESEWQEFFDKSAKAKYWFNKNTGEAVWTKPGGVP